MGKLLLGRKGLLLLIYSGTFMGPFTGNLVLPLIPLFEGEFNVGIEVAALTITAAVIPFAVLQVFSGGMSDIYGRRRMTVLGFAIGTVGAILATVSLDINLFLASRVIQGAGSALMAPIMLALIGDCFSYEERGKIMGGYAATTSAGIALGPIVGGFLALYDWRYAFILMAVLSLVMIPVSILYLKPAPKGEKAFRTLPRIMFSTLKQHNVSLACITGLLVFLMGASTLTFLSDFLGKPPLLVNPAEIGLLLSIGGFASIVTAPAVGFLIDAIGRRRTAVIGGILILLAFIIFTLTSKTYWQFLTPLIIMFIGQSFAFTALGTVTIDSTTQSRGAASSIYNTFRFTGYGIGPALMAPVYIALGLTGTLASFIIVALATLILIMRVKTVQTSPKVV
jgi:MFS family permease